VWSATTEEFIAETEVNVKGAANLERKHKKRAFSVLSTRSNGPYLHLPLDAGVLEVRASLAVLGGCDVGGLDSQHNGVHQVLSGLHE